MANCAAQAGFRPPNLMCRAISEAFRGNQQLAWAGLALVLALGMWVYRDVGGYAFVRLGDPALVSNNPYVNRGLDAEAVRWAFTFKESPNQPAEPLAPEQWAPLSMLSLALDVQVAGLDAAFHHRVNLCLHLLSTCLTFLFFHRLTRVPLLAVMVAAVFCIHPMHAESVAWISGRKDVLSTLLVLGALNLYLTCKLRPGGGGRGRWWWATLVCFAIACLAKPAAIVTPLLLLWIDAWLDRQRADGTPSRGLRFQIRQKMPFFLVMLAVAAMTIAMKLTHFSPSSGVAVSLLTRVLEIPFALLFYLERTLWPHYLFAHYERYPQPFAIATMVGVTVIAVISWGAWWLRDRAPEWWFGWGWFLICLLPAIGFTGADPSFTADRYTYLAHCGLAFAVLKSMARLIERWRGWFIPLLALNLIYLVRITPAAHEAASTWRDSETLLRHGVLAQPSSGRTWNHLGALLVERGELEEGVAYLKRSIELGGMIDAYYNLATATLGSGGSPQQAVLLLRECLRLDPGNGAAMELLGKLLGDPERIDLYDPDESRSLIERAQELKNK